MHTHKLVIVFRYLQNRPTLQIHTDWWHQLLNSWQSIYHSRWEVQRFSYKYQWSELWYLSSDAVPQMKLRKPPPTSAKPCVFVDTHFHILFPCLSVLIYLATLNFRGCSSSEQPVSEPRHPWKPSCLFIVLYLQHPWPLVLFLHISFKFLSAQLLVG